MKRLAFALVLLVGACTSAPRQHQPTGESLPPAPPAGGAAELIGLTGPQLQGMLGRAAFTRRENGSELWRYDNPQCRAFFFLYVEGGVMRVRHVETVPHGATAADPACLTVLRGKPVSPQS